MIKKLNILLFFLLLFFNLNIDTQTIYFINIKILQYLKKAMQTSDFGINIIKYYEGKSLKAYKATATEIYYTIGYGHYGSDVTQNMIITDSEATNYLQSDLKNTEKFILENVKTKLNQNQFDALVSLTYNIGIGNLNKSNLLDYLNSGNYEKAANEILKYNTAGGKYYKNLDNRRKEEFNLFTRKNFFLNYKILLVSLGIVLISGLVVYKFKEPIKKYLQV